MEWIASIQMNTISEVTRSRLSPPVFSVPLISAHRSVCRKRWFAIGLAIGLLAINTLQCHGARGQLELSTVDEKTHEPTAVRIKLRNSKGRPVFAPKAPRVGSGFVFDGKVVLDLNPGVYTFTIDKGPEFRLHQGHFVMRSGAADNQEVSMRRFVDMKAEGWWSGDLHVERPIREMPLRMLANDLHFANVVTWSNGKSAWKKSQPPSDKTVFVGNQRAFNLLGGRNRRAGSEIVFGQLSEPITLPSGVGEFPAPFESLRGTESSSRHVHLNRIDSLDFPVWVASGKLDSVGLLHPGLLEAGSNDDDTARARDPVLFPDPYGVGRWSQDIYFRTLNLGLRLAPAASSGAGINDNPVGYNRVYVHCGEQFSPQAWWQGLQAGRVLITNGPLLRPRANGQLPGHEFRSLGDAIQLEVEAQLSTREKIDYFEIIQDGRSVVQVRLEDWAAKGGRLPPVTFSKNGWMVVRVVTRNTDTYRCACSGPFYVSFPNRDETTPDATSLKFFLDWVYERARAIKLPPAEHEKVMRYHRAARNYWQALLEAAETEPKPSGASNSDSSDGLAHP